jgi:hypothetical protein
LLYKSSCFLSAIYIEAQGQSSWSLGSAPPGNLSGCTWPASCSLWENSSFPIPGYNDELASLRMRYILNVLYLLRNLRIKEVVGVQVGSGLVAAGNGRAAGCLGSWRWGWIHIL